MYQARVGARRVNLGIEVVAVLSIPVAIVALVVLVIIDKRRS